MHWYCTPFWSIDGSLVSLQPAGESGKIGAATRKRSTHGGGAMARRKRRLLSGEKRDTAPLLSMLPTSRTLAVEEVELQIKALINSLCQVWITTITVIITVLLKSVFTYC